MTRTNHYRNYACRIEHQKNISPGEPVSNCLLRFTFPPLSFTQRGQLHLHYHRFIPLDLHDGERYFLNIRCCYSYCVYTDNVASFCGGKCSRFSVIRPIEKAMCVPVSLSSLSPRGTVQLSGYTVHYPVFLRYRRRYSVS
jgi:hypothetical protein